jgi:hypothetical protein
MDTDFSKEEMTRKSAGKTADIMTGNIAAMISTEPWISRKTYAKHYGLSKSTIHRYTNFLRKICAISGEDKIMRYDKFCHPTTGEFSILKGIMDIVSTPKIAKHRQRRQKT